MIATDTAVSSDTCISCTYKEQIIYTIIPGAVVHWHDRITNITSNGVL